MQARNDSEQRPLPPTRKKLHEARKKGQVARSKDMVGAVTLVLAVAFLCLDAKPIGAAVVAMFTAAAAAAGHDFASGVNAIGHVAGTAALQTVAPLFGFVVIGAVVGNIAVMRGIPFAADPIVPRLAHVNPAEGFKRLFKLRALIELAKVLVRVTALATLLLVVLDSGAQTLVLLPGCGFGCIPTTFESMLMPMLAGATLLFVAAGLADVGLQTWLFRRDQRMSITEFKRERKEMEGDPLIRGHRRRHIREAATAPSRTGIAQASLLLSDGGTRVVGVRYRRGETPVPAVVCRGSGQAARRLIAEAARLNIGVLEHADVVRTLYRRTLPGQYVPDDTYQIVAAALVRAKVI
jgi:type III secretion protein U